MHDIKSGVNKCSLKLSNLRRFALSKNFTDLLKLSRGQFVSCQVQLMTCSPTDGPNVGAVIPKAIAVPVRSPAQHRNTSTRLKLKILVVALLLLDCSKY